jgi:hypothetical protein
MFRNGIKRRIFIPKGEEMTERIQSFTVSSLRQVKEDEVDGSYGTRGRVTMLTQFLYKTIFKVLKERDHFEDLSIDVRII